MRLSRSLFWHRRFVRKGLVRSEYRMLVVETTRRCHKYEPDSRAMGCRHCFLAPSVRPDLPEALFDVCLDLANQAFFSIGIGGGEPLLKPMYIEKAIAACPKVLVNVFTSADPLTPTLAAKLGAAENVVLTVSLHGTRSHHNFLMGEGAYERVQDRLALVGSYGIPWIRKVVVSRHNYDYVMSDAFAEDTAALGCTRADVCRYYPIGPKADWSLFLDRNQILALNEKLLELTDAGMCFHQERPGRSCKALLSVTCDGLMTPCPYVREPAVRVDAEGGLAEMARAVAELTKTWKQRNDGRSYCPLLQTLWDQRASFLGAKQEGGEGSACAALKSPSQPTEAGDLDVSLGEGVAGAGAGAPASPPIRHAPVPSSVNPAARRRGTGDRRCV